MRQNLEPIRFHYPPITDRNVRDGCYLTSMGHAVHPAGRSYPGEGHPELYQFDARVGRVFPDFGLVYIARGNGVFEGEGGAEQAVREGDFFCLTPGCWHRYAPEPATGWEEFWICFNGDYPHRLQINHELPRLPRLIRPDSGAAYARRLRLILDVLDEPMPGSTLGMGLRGLALFTEVSAEASRSPGGAESAEPEDELHSATKAFIDENLHRSIDIGNIAARLGVSRRTLERRFRQRAKLSPGDYIIRARVERASRLIESSTMSIKAVAYACGFSSPQQMIYDFHRHLGMAPGRLRRRGRG